MIFKSSFILALALQPLYLMADTVVWTNAFEQEDAQWSVLENWTNSVGDVLQVPPTNGENIVLRDLEELPVGGDYSEKPDDGFFPCQRITTGKSLTSAAVNPVIGSITGGERYTIQIDQYYDKSSTCTWMNPTIDWQRSFDVIDPNGFLGFWEPIYVSAAIKLHPTASFTPILHNLSSKYRPYVNVPTVDTQAKIGHLYGGGSIDKTGEGDLVIEATDFNPSYFWLRGGELLFTGTQEGDEESLLAQAAFHLDATRDDTLVKVADPAGLAITRWEDVRGNGLYAFWNNSYTNTHQDYLAFANTPLYVEKASRTGLPIVDFGNRSGEGGRTNCVLEIAPQKVSGIRAAFYAGAYPKGASNAMILGDIGTIDFVASGNDRVLFNNVYSAPAARWGDITINGNRTAYNACNADELKSIHVFGAGFSQGLHVGLLGSREYYKKPTGGSQLGELILFTNELTRAERAQVANYLYRKWISGAQVRYDASGVNALQGEARLTVPADKVANVGHVYAEGGLVKKGAGTLQLASLQPDNASITIEGGSVSFVHDALATNMPTDAYMWLDAEKLGAATEVDGDVAYVNTWKDCRDSVDRVATSGDSNGGTHRPTYIANSPFVNRPVVSMGDYGGEGSSYYEGRESAAWMKMPNWNDYKPSTYHYFMVFRLCYDPNTATRNGAKNVAYLSSSNMSGYRDNLDRILSVSYPNPVTMNAKWRMNGIPIDPRTYQPPKQDTNNFYLVSISSPMPFTADGIAKDRANGGVMANCGGLEVGEFITFDHPISVDEHLAVESYLLKKWFNKAHPLSSASVSNLTFGTSISPVVSVDGSVFIRNLSGNNNAIIKQGAGKAFINSANTIKNIQVVEGELQVSILNDVGAFMFDAQYWFDASADESFTKDAAGGILEWNDVRHNGVKATADTDGLANVKPTVEEVEVRPGVMRKAVDFKGLSWTTNGVGEVKDAASMTFSQRFYSAEAFTVISDAHGSNAQSFFCDTQYHNFGRGLDGARYYYVAGNADGMNSDGVCINSYSYTDGNALGSPKEGFQIFNWMLLTASQKILWTGWTPRPMNAFARFTYTTLDKGIVIDRRGGQYICEQISFPTAALTDEQRAYVTAGLKSKWYGEKTAYTNTIDSLNVAAGAKAHLVAIMGEALKVSTLEGNGTILADSLMLGGTLNTTLLKGSQDVLNITGDLALEGPITLNLTADISAGKFEGGDYPILAANSITGFDPSNWTVNVTTLGPNLGRVTIFMRDNVIYAHLPVKGLKLFLR